MAKLLINDEIDYPSTWYPTHVIGLDNKLISVYIGSSQSLLGGYGIWIADEDYDKIRHDRAYIFIHNPDANNNDVENVNWDDIPIVKDNKKTNREHIHLWKED